VSVILGLTGSRRVHSGFLHIPLDLRDPHGLAVLAAIITSTPTSWVGVSTDGTQLATPSGAAAWRDLGNLQQEYEAVELARLDGVYFALLEVWSG